MSERAFPNNCPYCAETDLFPREDGWECRACLRAFSLKYLGMIEPRGGAR